MDNFVFGRNNVYELLKDGSRSVSKIILMKNMKENSKIDQILDLARQRGIVFQFQPKEKFTQFKEFSHQGVVAYVSPVKYVDLNDFLSKEKDTLCEKCQTRLEKNPLRVLDCKLDGARFAGRVPTMCLCEDCQAHFDEVQALLKGKIDFEVDPMLVRGLDYYSRTVFEFQAGDASQNAIAAGGRYDTLVKNMGGPATPAIGWAMGVERVIASRGEVEFAKERSVYVVSLGKECNETAFNLMQDLRAAGIRTEGGLFDKNAKGQMKQANRCAASYALILGEDELAKQEVTFKDLNTGDQKQISLTDIVQEVKKLI